MVSALIFFSLVLIVLVWLCLLLHWAWPRDPAAYPLPPASPPALPKRQREPKPFAGLTHNGSSLPIFEKRKQFPKVI
jgi:hypothetical protein